MVTLKQPQSTQWNSNDYQAYTNLVAQTKVRSLSNRTGIKSYEYDEYQPVTGTQLNNAGQIKITIEKQDQFLHLHNSYLLIEGDLLKADDTR